MNITRRVMRSEVDLGAYENGCPSDFDGDCCTKGLDLAFILGAWTGAGTYSPCPPYSIYDLNEDCKINGLDIAILLGAWDTCAACSDPPEYGCANPPESFGPGPNWLEQFMQWLEEQDWEAFLAWYAEQ